MKRFVAIAILVTACAPEKPAITNEEAHDNSAVVLEVNGEELTLAEYERRLNALPEIAETELQSVDAKRNQLEYVAQFEALADFAEKEGYATDPRAMVAIKKEIVKIVEEGKLTIDEATLSERVDEAIAQRTTPESRRLSVLESNDLSVCAAVVDETASLSFGERLATMQAHPLTKNLGFVGPDDAPPATNLGYETPIGNVAMVTDLKKTTCWVVMPTGRIPSQKPARGAIEQKIRAEMLVEARNALRKPRE